jgi:hypothetical protein
MFVAINADWVRKTRNQLVGVRSMNFLDRVSFAQNDGLNSPAGAQ